MARSLAKIQEQIAKLQKEADSIQSSVIARIKKEIAQHGLTAEHLFGSKAETSAEPARTRRAKAVKAVVGKKKAADKPPKYADGEGNTWGGMGKRPQWLRAALDAGHSIEEFLATATKPAAIVKAPRARKTAATPPTKKALAKRKTAKAAKAPAKQARKAAAPAKKKPAKKSPAKKAAPAAPDSAQNPAA